MFKVRGPYQRFSPRELSLFCEISFEKIDFGGNKKMCLNSKLSQSFYEKNDLKKSWDLAHLAPPTSTDISDMVSHKNLSLQLMGHKQKQYFDGTRKKEI
jgi:hypothetical protein